MTSFSPPPSTRSTRQLRMAGIIKAKLADIFNRGDFYTKELYGCSLTVSEVQITSDMRHAVVYIWPLGKSLHSGNELLEALSKEAPRLNAAVAKIMTSRSTPRLEFKFDQLFDQAEAMEKLLKDPKIQQDLNKDDE